MSAAIVSMVFASCTNEELVNQAADGRMFTLEVSQGMDSRTTLNQTPEGYQTLWSAGDQIYVTSEDGKTTGVLTLVSKPGLADGTFQGYVFGEGELNYTVFPVPENGVIDLNNPDEGEMDLPMVGTIVPNGPTVFKNACALVNLDIDGLPKNTVVSVSGDEVVSSATFNAETGKMEVNTSAVSGVSVKASSQELLVPVFIKSATTVADTDLNISVEGATFVMEDVDLATEKVSVSSVTKLIYNVTTNAEGEKVVSLGKQLDGNDPEVKPEDISNALSSGTSVIVTDKTKNETGTYEIGNSEKGIPTVIEFNDISGNITIAPTDGSAPEQDVKVVIATDLIEGQKINIDESLVEQTEIVFQNNTDLDKVIDALPSKINVDVTVELAGENQVFPNIQGASNSDNTFTIIGKGKDETTLDGKKNNNSNAPGDFAHNMNVVMKDLTYVTANNGYNGGFGHAASVEFVNCTIIGQFYAQSNAPHTFTDCTIDPLNGYLYTYASDCTFERCTFQASKGKALQVYEDAKTGENTVIIKDCKFIAAEQAKTWDGKPVTAIDINSNGANFNVTISNCTATGFPVGLNSGSSLWNNKCDMKYITLTIDGTEIK